MNEAKAASPPGLQDVVAGESSICYLDGENGKLLYRGYDIEDLTAHSSFEEVAYLLWYGRLPGKIEFQAFLDTFTGNMELPVETVMILRMFPKKATPMPIRAKRDSFSPSSRKANRAVNGIQSWVATETGLTSCASQKAR